MDYMKDFEALMKRYFQNMEDKLYNGLIENMIGDTDSEVGKATLAVIRAFNRHGVSSRVVFEAVMDASKELEKDE